MYTPPPNPAIIARKDNVVQKLRAAMPVGSFVISDPNETRAYECDALSAYRAAPMAVVLPDSTAAVAAALAVCYAEGVPVVARGSGTSLAGGALPTEDSVVIGVSKLNRILECNYNDRFIRVESGITNLAVTKAIENDGFFYAPDPSSQLACAIGGNIGMNSGGAHCLKYGVTTNNVLGVKMVLIDGRIIDITGHYGDSTGLDLLGLVCGSEGGLGIVTEATLKIIPKPDSACPILIGFDSNETAGTCVAHIIQAGILPVAIEFMDRACVQACEAYAHAGYPDCQALLIVEVEGAECEIDEQIKAVMAIANTLSPVHVRVAQSNSEAEKIWLGRKSAFSAVGRMNDYMCLDGTIPISALPQTLKRIGELSNAAGLKVVNVFHAGDGNMHPLILYDASKPKQLAACEKLGADILQLCVAVGGCLTGEHGVGMEKRELMHTQFSATDLEAQMQIKDVFDPNWLLNPTKVFPLASSAHRRNAQHSTRAAQTDNPQNI